MNLSQYVQPKLHVSVLPYLYECISELTETMAQLIEAQHTFKIDWSNT